MRSAKSFEAYVRYDDPDAFVVDLEDVWQWIGFSRKDHGKRLLVGHFAEGTDFKVLNRSYVSEASSKTSPRSGEQWDTNEPVQKTTIWASTLSTTCMAKHQKEIVLMTVDTFKDLCMTAQTEKGKLVRRYFRKMETILLKYETQEREREMSQKMLEHERDAKARIERSRHAALIQSFCNQPSVYFAKVRQLDDTRWILKIGATDDIKKRAFGLAAYFGMAIVIDVIPCVQYFAFERFLLKHPDLLQIQCSEDVQPGVRSTETYYVTDEIYKKVLSVAKKNVGDFMGLDQRIRLEQEKVEMERERIKLEQDKVEMERERIRLELKKCEMAEKGIVIPPSVVEQPVPSPPTTTAASAAEEASPSREADEEIDEQHIDESDERLMVMIGSRRLAKGHKIQRYDTADGALLQTYQGEVDVLRHFPGTTCTLLKKAIATKTTYKGFRWAHLPKDEPDDTVQDIGRGSSEGNVKASKHGPVAMLTPDKSRIEQVFPTQRAAAAYFRFNSNSVISLALKDPNRRCGGHYFRAWDECDEDLQGDFLARRSLPEPHAYASGTAVAKLHPVTLKPLKVYPSVAECTKIHHFGRRTLKNAISCGELLQGFRWKEVEDEK